MLVATLTTGLRCVAWVNTLNTGPALLPFVRNKGIQLVKTPTVQAPFRVMLLARADLGCLSNVREILKHDDTARGNTLDNVLGQDMIAIPAETGLFAAHLCEMTLRRFTSFGLQLSPQAKAPSFKLFPPSFPQVRTVGGDGRVVQSQVYSGHHFIFGNSRLRDRDHHVQGKPPCAFTQLSSGDSGANILGSILRAGEEDILFTTACREPNEVPLPVEDEGFLVIADRTGHALRTAERFQRGCGLALLQRCRHLLGRACLMFRFPGEGALEGFRGFDASLNEQVTHQPRTRRFGAAIGAVMQFHAVPFLVFPSIGAHSIEGVSELPQRLMQGGGLFWGRMQEYLHGSVHRNRYTISADF